MKSRYPCEIGRVGERRTTSHVHIGAADHPDRRTPAIRPSAWAGKLITCLLEVANLRKTYEIPSGDYLSAQAPFTGKISLLRLNDLSGAEIQQRRYNDQISVHDGPPFL